MTRSRLIKTGVVAFFAGVTLATFSTDAAMQGMVMFLAGAAGILPWRRYGVVRTVLIIAAFFAVGIIRYLSAVPGFGSEDVAFYRDMEGIVVLEGVVAGEPDVRSDSTYYVVGARKLEAGGVHVAVRGNVLVKMSRYPGFVYGDGLRLKGRLQSPPVIEGFTYGEGLAKNGIWTVMYRPAVSGTAKAAAVDGWTAVLGLKGLISARTREVFAEPAAAIAAGVLLGLRSSIPSETMEDFNATGLTHILAISGYNITLIISIFGLLLGKSGRKSRFWFSTAGVVFFVLITGMSASVIRAAVMGWFTLLSGFSGRKSSGVQTLLLSGAAMVAVNPRILLYDMSFQLSFLATLGILLYVPILEEKAGFLRKVPAFARESLTVTLAAQVFTVPLMLWRFGRLSLISPLTNIVFLPLIPAIMLFSAAGIVSSFLIPPAADVIAAANWVLCRILVDGVGFAAALPFASLKTEDFPVWAVFAYYALSLGFAIFFRRPRSARYSLPHPVPACARLSSCRPETRTTRPLPLS